MIVADDLQALEPSMARHHLLLGKRADKDDTEVRIAPYGVNLLLSGSSGAGKSTLATALLERLAERGYQFCIIDPEGDYGVQKQRRLWATPCTTRASTQCSNWQDIQPEYDCQLLGIALEHRPGFFEKLLPRIQELRARSGDHTGS